MQEMVARCDPDRRIRLDMVALPHRLEPDQVRLRMLFAPVNPADLLAISGSYAFAFAQDAVLGAAGVGEVIAVGGSVDRLAPGDLALPLDRGNWCTGRIVHQARVRKVPADVGRLRAALMRINPPTAWLLLNMAQVGSGDLLILNGARSSVGEWVRHLAARREVTIANLARAPIEANQAAAGWWDEAQNVDLLRPATAALDCVAGSATGKLASLLGEGGRLIVYGHLSGDPCTVRSNLLTGRGLTISGFSLRRAETLHPGVDAATMWAELWAASAVVQPERRVRTTLPLSAVADSDGFLQEAARGRLVLELS